MALANGTLSPGDIKGLQLPAQEAPAGWNPMSSEDDHPRVGAMMGQIAERMRQGGRPETAEAMTVEAWVRNAMSEGACAAERADTAHGHVRCGDERGHPGNHAPRCPECDIVKEIMYAVARKAPANGAGSHRERERLTRLDSRNRSPELGGEGSDCYLFNWLLSVGRTRGLFNLELTQLPIRRACIG